MPTWSAERRGHRTRAAIGRRRACARRGSRGAASPGRCLALCWLEELNGDVKVYFDDNDRTKQSRFEREGDMCSYKENYGSVFLKGKTILFISIRQEPHHVVLGRDAKRVFQFGPI